jgi:rare lipoprotein A
MFDRLRVNACMASQTREQRTSVRHAPEDWQNMQAIKALALSLTAFALAFSPMRANAADTAQKAQVSVAAITTAAPVAHFTIAHEIEKLIETGKATWYGRRHSHSYTVSGERFDPSQLTAAHRSLPIGAMVRVTDRDTGRSVVVRVNDREPPHGKRCIDLSEGAAQALGIRDQGVANVAISAVVPGDAVEVAEAPDEPTPRPVAGTHAAATHRRHVRH